MTREEALKRLREVCPPGTTVHTILRHASRSGMSRRISAVVFTPNEDGKGVSVFELDGLIEALGSFKRRKVKRYGMSGSSWMSYEDGLVVGGCGMDMGFHLVYSVSTRLYPDGFGIPMLPVEGEALLAGFTGPHTPSTKEEAEKLYANGWRAERGRNGDRSGWDASGGYALNHRWM